MTNALVSGTMPASGSGCLWMDKQTAPGEHAEAEQAGVGSSFLFGVAGENPVVYCVDSVLGRELAGICAEFCRQQEVAPDTDSCHPSDRGRRMQIDGRGWHRAGDPLGLKVSLALLVH